MCSDPNLDLGVESKFKLTILPDKDFNKEGHERPHEVFYGKWDKQQDADCLFWAPLLELV